MLAQFDILNWDILPPQISLLSDKIFIHGSKFECLHEMGTEGSPEERGNCTGEDDRMWNYEQAASETAAALDHNFYGEDLDKKGIRDLLLTSTVKLIISKATPNAEAIEDQFMEVLMTNL